MIRLDIEEYCNNCRYFDPEARKCDPLYMDPLRQSLYVSMDTFVSCTRRNQCRAIYGYLRKEISNERKERDTESN